MRVRQVKIWLRRHKTLLLRIGVGAVGVLILAQILYPGDKLLPFESVDGMQMSAWSKSDAVKKLDSASSVLKLDVKVAGDDKVYTSAKPGDFGLKIINDTRVRELDYPWYLRIVPTSVLWASVLSTPGDPGYERSDDKLKAYVTKTFGENCLVQPTNAGIVTKGIKLEVTPAKEGGRCKTDEIIRDFKNATPSITGSHTVNVAVEPIPADVTTKAATDLRDKLEKQVKSGVKIDVLGEEVTIPAAEVTKWIRVTATGKELVVAVDPATSDAYFDTSIAKKVAINPGITRVTTRDFTEISRQNGSAGRALSRDATRATIVNVLNGAADRASAVTMQVSPKVEYTYTYSKTKEGISALMKNYDTEHGGEFGAMLVELNGSGVARWQEDKVFVTASTYKLFVAYGTLRKVEAGQWHWGDANIYGGRNLEQCFDYMIVNSNNECAEVLLKRLGFRWLTDELKGLGLTKSGFMGSNPETTAGDLALFLTKLQRGDMPVNTASRERLLSAMSRQVYRRGIPAGASGSVADKVGFMDGLLHDAAIVYSPKGTYILVIMSNGSSWDAIADLTRKIEELR